VINKLNFVNNIGMKENRFKISFRNSFDVIKKLGEGRYGQVYRVEDKCDHKTYAIKKCQLHGK